MDLFKYTDWIWEREGPDWNTAKMIATDHEILEENYEFLQAKVCLKYPEARDDISKLVDESFYVSTVIALQRLNLRFGLFERIIQEMEESRNKMSPENRKYCQLYIHYIHYLSQKLMEWYVKEHHQDSISDVYHSDDEQRKAFLNSFNKFLFENGIYLFHPKGHQLQGKPFVQKHILTKLMRKFGGYPEECQNKEIEKRAKNLATGVRNNLRAVHSDLRAREEILGKSKFEKMIPDFNEIEPPKVIKKFL